MDKLKDYILKNFEQVFVLLILITIAYISYYIPYKITFLNFYFLPVIIAGYYLGFRRSVLGAFLCILFVMVYVVIYPERFILPSNRMDIYLHVIAWGGFLILSGAVVGLQQEKLSKEIQRTNFLNEELEQNQKELAERIASEPRRKSYAALSVVCQAAFEPNLRGDLQPGSFYPAPKVTSSILELSPASDGPEDRAFFSRVVRSLFRSRRKTLRNNLQSSFLAQYIPLPALLEQVRDAGIDEACRPETLTARDFMRLVGRFREIQDRL